MFLLGTLATFCSAQHGSIPDPFSIKLDGAISVENRDQLATLPDSIPVLTLNLPPSDLNSALARIRQLEISTLIVHSRVNIKAISSALADLRVNRIQFDALEGNDEQLALLAALPATTTLSIAGNWDAKGEFIAALAKGSVLHLCINHCHNFDPKVIPSSCEHFRSFAYRGAFAESVLQSVSKWPAIEYIDVERSELAATKPQNHQLGEYSYSRTLRYVRFASLVLKDANLKSLWVLPKLICVHVIKCVGFTEQAFEGMGQSQSLTVLCFRDTAQVPRQRMLSDAALTTISKVSKLEELEIDGVFTDSGVAELSIGLASCTSLALDSPNLSLSALSRCGRFQCLRALTINAFDFGPPSEQLDVKGLTKLQRLSMTVQSLVGWPAVINKLTSLQELRLNSSEDGLSHEFDEKSELPRSLRLVEISCFGKLSNRVLRWLANSNIEEIRFFGVSSSGQSFVDLALVKSLRIARFTFCSGFSADEFKSLSATGVREIEFVTCHDLSHDGIAKLNAAGGTGKPLFRFITCTGPQYISIDVAVLGLKKRLGVASVYFVP